MLIAGGIVAVIGIVLIVVAVFQRRRSDTFAASEELTCTDLLAQIDSARASLGPSHFSKHVAVRGQLVASPAGELLSPLTRTPCVWHRSIIRRRHLEWVTEHNERRRRETTSLEHEASSTQPFGLADADAVIIVDPSRASVDEPETVLDVYEPVAGGGAITGVDVEVFGIRVGTSGGDNTLGYQREEFVLRPGATMHVIGMAGDSTGQPRIASADGVKVSISTRSRGDLVRSSARNARAFAITGSVILLVGAVLLVVGFLI